MPGVEVWLFAGAVAGLFLQRGLGRVTCPACGSRRCSAAPVVHLVAGSAGDRITSHHCSACGVDFLFLDGRPVGPRGVSHPPPVAG